MAENSATKPNLPSLAAIAAICGILGAFGSWVATYATNQATTAESLRQQGKFQADVDERFKALKIDNEAKQAEVNRHIAEVLLQSNTRADQLGTQLNTRTDGVDRRIEIQIDRTATLDKTLSSLQSLFNYYVQNNERNPIATTPVRR